jgi:hypothetical protein
MDFKDYIERQKEWSLRTFGEGKRTEGIVKHIQAELQEILEAKTETDRLIECIDVIILSMDLAWRLGNDSEYIEVMLDWKQERNFNRQWPPKEVSEANQDEPTFHIKTFE